ncbi:hypothetical protein H9W06_004422 [Vibrio vulnificus]|nr:hypothetical protein [Vibrio vulnificus]
MDSRVHGNDGKERGGGVLSFYVRVPLLMCLVSSYPLLFKLIPYNFGLSASFCLSVRHPRKAGKHRQRVLKLGITASLSVLLFGCSMLLPIAASTCPNATSGVCG